MHATKKNLSTAERVGRKVDKPQAVQFGHPGDAAAVIAKALGGSRSGRGWLAACPAHPDKTPSLSISPGTKQPVIVKCFAGCSFEEVRQALHDLGLWPGGDGLHRIDPTEWARRQAAFEEERKRKEAEQIEVARNLWIAARPIERGDLADRYLREVRGFSLLQWPDSLRFGSYTSSRTGRTWPALIAAATLWHGFGDSSLSCYHGGPRFPGLRAVQITPLRPDGSPAWSSPKRITRGVVKGGSVKIADKRYGAPIVIVEGVEDALAIFCVRPDLNIWAVLGVENAATVDLAVCSTVILCLDGDKAGTEAAIRAHDALSFRQHKVSRVRLPAGVDPAAAFSGGKSHA